ncbi:hypothetical protein ACP4OV_017555 [Aristida adscensionis]
MSRDSQDNGSRTYHGIERSKGLAAPCNSIMEDDLDSTASTPPCPVLIGPEQPPTLPIVRNDYQQSKTELTGANKRATYHVPVPETSGQSNQAGRDLHGAVWDLRKEKSAEEEKGRAE